MPKTKQQFEAMKQQTLARIQEAALLLFSTQGMAATNYGEVARAAGISNGLLYRYYESKEVLFRHLVQDALAQTALAMRGYADADGTAQSRLAHISQVITGILARDGRTARYFLLLTQAALAGQPIAGLTEDNLRAAAIPFDTLRGIIEQGQREGTVKPGDPRQLAILFWAAFQGLCIFRLTMQTFAPPGAAQLSGILLKEEALLDYERNQEPC